MISTLFVDPCMDFTPAARLCDTVWVGGRRRRAYDLTPAGRTALGEHRALWQQFSTAVTALLTPPPRPAPA